MRIFLRIMYENSKKNKLPTDFPIKKKLKGKSSYVIISFEFQNSQLIYQGIKFRRQIICEFSCKKYKR